MHPILFSDTKNISVHSRVSRLFAFSVAFNAVAFNAVAFMLLPLIQCPLQAERLIFDFNRASISAAGTG